MKLKKLAGVLAVAGLVVPGIASATNGYFGALNGSGTVTVNSVAFIGRTNSNGSSSAAWTGTPNVDKIGTGTQVLSGTDSGLGWLMASGGTLELTTGYSKSTNDFLYVGAYDQATWNDNLAVGMDHAFHRRVVYVDTGEQLHHLHWT